MAVITTYATLSTAIGDYLARSDLTTFIPNFVQNCEEKLYRELRISAMEKALSVSISSGVAAVPSDYLEMRYAYLTTSPITWLERLSPEDIYSRYPSRSGGGEIPKFYAREGTDFIFGPYPGAYTMAGIYYAKLTLLRNDVDGTNWFTTNAPDLLLYGSLLEAEPFIKNDARLALWRQMYAESLALVKRQDRMENWSGGSLRARTA